MGPDLRDSPDGKLYLIGHGAQGTEPEAWMQGSSVYMARCEPTVAAVNDRQAWEFYAGTEPGGQPKWVAGAVTDAQPIFVWANRTGVATMSYVRYVPTGTVPFPIHLLVLH